MEKTNSNMSLHKRNFIPMLKSLNNIYTKQINDIYSLYHISQTKHRIPDTETSKCVEYMSYSLLNRNEIIPGVSNYNWTQINLYIIKLGIEETYVNNKLKILETKWNQKNE